MTAGDNDRRGSNTIEPPGLFEAAKHGSVDTWKWDESLGRDHAAGQDNNGIIGLDFSGVYKRGIARFQWVAQQID